MLIFYHIPTITASITASDRLQQFSQRPQVLGANPGLLRCLHHRARNTIEHPVR
jgi:hypothetical protein